MSKTAAVLGGSINQGIWGINNDEIKHVNTPEELREVAKALEVRVDWHEPDEQGLTLEYNGKLFDNAGIWGHQIAIAPDSLEQYVTIRKNDRPVAEINMANLFAWASKLQVEDTPDEKPPVGLHKNLQSPEFHEFLYKLLCNADTMEHIHIEPVAENVMAVCAFGSEPIHRSWCLAVHFEDENLIRVSNGTGTHEFSCMTEEEARKELVSKIYHEAENMRDLSDLYELLDQFTDIDASRIFTEAARNTHSMSVNFYDVLKDMDQDPDDILSDAIDDAAHNTPSSTLMEVASTHFDLSSDDLIETAIDQPNREIPAASLLHLAKEMGITIDPSVESALDI